jgi:hypothetical protein
MGLAAGFCLCFRVFDVGVAQVTLVSAGGTVMSHAQIRDVVVHEEYRNHGPQLLLNDIGTVADRLPSYSLHFLVSSLSFT